MVLNQLQSSDSVTCVTTFGDSTRIESQSMTQDSSQSHFYKISEPLMGKPSSFSHKEMIIFCFSDDRDPILQDWPKFSVLPV